MRMTGKLRFTIEVEIIFQNFYENVLSFYSIEKVIYRYNYILYNLK